MNRMLLESLLVLTLAISPLHGQEMSLSQSQQIVREAFGQDIPFELLPRENGKIVPITVARERRDRARQRAEARALARFFPESSKASGKDWITVEGDDGRSHQVPDPKSPKYRKFIATCDEAYVHIDRGFEEKYAKKYEAFSEALRKGQSKNLEFVGQAQKQLDSDIDVTIRDAKLAEALARQFEANGLKVSKASKGHELYVESKTVDWLMWNDKTVSDLRERVKNAPDEASRARAQAHLDRAMADKEVCASTAGAEQSIFGGKKNPDGSLQAGPGAVDAKGAVLDHIKKHAQSEDVYTKSKTSDKILKLDFEAQARKDVTADPALAERARKLGWEKVVKERAKALFAEAQSNPESTASRKLAAKTGTTAALRLEGMPEPVKRKLEAEFVKARQDEMVEVYRKASLKSQMELDTRMKARKSYRDMARQAAKEGNKDWAKKMDALADDVDGKIQKIRRSNDETFRAVAEADPALARRLMEAETDARRSFMKNRKAELPGRRDLPTEQSYVRNRVEAFKAKCPWLPVAKDATVKVVKGSQKVFGTMDGVAAYAGIWDDAQRLEAEGKGSAKLHIAKETGKKLVTDRLLKKYPKLGSFMQVMNAPSMAVAEMERQIDEAQAKGTSTFHARVKGVVNLVKQNTMFGTIERILNEEGMAEVDREMANGNYSWFDVAMRTTVYSVGEITPMNTILRSSANAEFDVHRLTKEAREAEMGLRHKVVNRSYAASAEQAALRRGIVALQLRPDAHLSPVKERIEALQARHDQSVQRLHDLAKKMRLHSEAGVGDTMVDDLYKRTAMAKKALDTELLEGKMLQLAAARDTMTVESFLELKKLQKDYVKKVDAYRETCKTLFAHRGTDDALMQEMLGTLRNMKDRAEKMGKVDFDVREQWFRENEAERKKKEAAERAMQDAFVQRHEAGKLPSGLDPEDLALVPELETLREKQKKGKIGADADLLAMAWKNVLADATYNELKARQKEGELAEDADLGALQEQIMRLRARQDRGEIDPDADLLALAQAGEGREEAGEPPSGEGETPPGGEEPGESENLEGDTAGATLERLSEEGENGTAPLSEVSIDVPTVSASATEGGIDYVAEAVAYTKKIETAKDAEGRLTSKYSLTQGNRKHGLHVTWSEGQMRTAEGYKDGVRHGPSRQWASNGTLIAESFFKEGKLHGPIRTWTEKGTLTSMELRSETTPFPVGLWKSYDGATGKLSAERSYVDAPGGLLHGWQRSYSLQSDKVEREQLYVQGVLHHSKHYDGRTGKLRHEEIFAASAARPPTEVDRRNGAVPSKTPCARIQRSFDLETERMTSEIHQNEKGQVVLVRHWKANGTKTLEERIDPQGGGLRTQERWFDNGLRSHLVTYKGSQGSGRDSINVGGAKHGREMEFTYPNGRLKRVRHWKDGVLHGSCRAFDEEGRKTYVGRYVNGVAMEETMYLRGRSGTMKGRVCDIRRHVHDPKTKKAVKHGRWERWYEENGKAMYVENWSMGTKHGLFRTYRKDGTVEREYVYDMGKPHGQSRVFHPNGKVKTVQHWNHGVLEGLLEDWDAAGWRQSLKTYRKGKPHGKAFTYHPDGKIGSLGHAVDGKSHGYYAAWNPQGQVTVVTYWLQGRYVKRPEYLAARADDPSLPEPPEAPTSN